VGVRVEDRLRRRDLEIRARQIVVAAGVWTDGLLGSRRLRPTKGIHLVVPRSRIGNRTAVLIPAPDGRVVFAIPWGDRDIIGTTDTDYTGDLDRPKAEADDVAYLRSRVEEALGVRLEKSDILATYAGLRPLVSSAQTDPSDVTRESSINRTPDGLIVVVGGKLTTFRSMARRIVDLARPDLPRSRTHKLDLFAPTEEGPPDLVRAYGSEAHAVLALAGQEPIHESSARRLAEIEYAVKSEACVGVADFLVRRTRAVLFDPERGRLSAEPVARRMGAFLGWDRREISRQVEAFESESELYR
jgi:glycerol-3-phosphate dehydrogenase